MRTWDAASQTCLEERKPAKFSWQLAAGTSEPGPEKSLGETTKRGGNKRETGELLIVGEWKQEAVGCTRRARGKGPIVGTSEYHRMQIAQRAKNVGNGQWVTGSDEFNCLAAL
jgi:hypothetical protein